MRCDGESLLQPHATCWRVEQATAATLLIDAAAYFDALCAALLGARRQVLIAGWEVDTRTVLRWRPHEVRLGELLGWLVRRCPQLQVYVACWDHHLLYAKGRESGTARRLRRLGGGRIQFCADGHHAPTGSVHHKLVVIDDAVAFCGGIDLTQRRWDTCAHVPDERRRRDHAGRAYRPMHDTQMLVAGPVAAALGDYLRDRWHAARGVEIEPPAPAPPDGLPWPEGVTPDFADVPVGVARTLPAHHGMPAVREIQQLYTQSIRAARRELYFENQYFTSLPIARALAGASADNPQLQGLLVCPAIPRTLFERCTMGYGRIGFHRVLQEAAVGSRLALVAPRDAAAQPIIVHSKLAVIDDRLLLVGSANLNNRSMGFDAECNLALEARSAAHRQRIRALRNRLLGEHLGRTAAEIAAECAAGTGLAELPRRLADRPRRLLPVTPVTAAPARQLGPLLCPLFDRVQADAPRRPAAPGDGPVGRAGRVAAEWSRIAVLAVATLLGLALLGQFVVTESQVARAALEQWSELF